MRFDDDVTDRERWAEDHGYWRGICPVHGHFWTDTGFGCENCLNDKEDYQDDAPEDLRCSDPADSSAHGRPGWNG